MDYVGLIFSGYQKDSQECWVLKIVDGEGDEVLSLY